jgi:adenylate cyclase
MKERSPFIKPTGFPRACARYDYMACWRENPRASLNRSYQLARRAVLLDETDSFAHGVLGNAYLFRREYEEARLELLESLALNPSDFLARRFYAMFLTATGKAEEGIEYIAIGRRLNPFDRRWVSRNMGIVYFSARRYEEAVAARQMHSPLNGVSQLT